MQYQSTINSMGPPPPQSSSRRGSTSDGAQKPCPYCTKTVKDIDWFLPCSRCGVNCHHRCLALDDKGYKAVKDVIGKVPVGFVHLYCLNCKASLDSLEERVAALEAKGGNNSTTPGSGAMDETVIARIVSQVVETVLPKVLAAAQEAASEAIERNGKKNSLVLVGLDEKANTDDF